MGISVLFLLSALDLLNTNLFLGYFCPTNPLISFLLLWEYRAELEKVTKLVPFQPYAN